MPDLDWIPRNAYGPGALPSVVLEAPEPWLSSGTEQFYILNPHLEPLTQLAETYRKSSRPHQQQLGETLNFSVSCFQTKDKIQMRLIFWV